MITTMNEQPEIVLSSLDVARIEAIIDQTPAAPLASQLEAELARGRVVSPQEIPDDVVTMNSRVCFCLKENGREFEKVLCYPADADKIVDGLSILTPVGSSLLGLRVGQTMRVLGQVIAAPLAGETKLSDVRVTAIQYQPERAGDYHT